MNPNAREVTINEAHACANVLVCAKRTEVEQCPISRNQSHSFEGKVTVSKIGDTKDVRTPSNEYQKDRTMTSKSANPTFCAIMGTEKKD